MSSGFGEGMGAGEGILESVAAELAASGMRILGPNCEGLASLPADAPLTFSPVLDVAASGTRLRPGNIAVISQSGGLGFAVAQWGTAVGLDFSYIISTGNEFDIDGLELAGSLVELPDTDIVIMLIEGVHDMTEFAQVAARFRQLGKRLVVAKLGRTEPGARGAYAHTRHRAGDAAEYARLFRAYDVIEVAEEEELIDVVQAVAKTRRLGARELAPAARIGIATTSGGAGVWLADACAARGFAVPVLSAPTQERLKPLMPPFGSPANPVDMTAQLTASGSVVPALTVLAESGEVDAITLVTSLSSSGRLERDREAFAGLIGSTDIPIFVFSYTKPAPSCVQILEELGIPWYTSATRAARGLAALVRGEAHE
jgi:acyl-CoA synthetase (NDP forming)